MCFSKTEVHEDTRRPRISTAELTRVFSTHRAERQTQHTAQTMRTEQTHKATQSSSRSSSKQRHRPEQPQKQQRFPCSCSVQGPQNRGCSKSHSNGRHLRFLTGLVTRRCKVGNQTMMTVEPQLTTTVAPTVTEPPASLRLSQPRLATDRLHFDSTSNNR